MDPGTHTGLVRGIRRWDLAAVAINGTIGAGIFGLPSKVYALSGAYSLLAFLICALVTALIILCFAEVGSRFSDTGGPYLYAREAFGPVVGFEVGWLMWLARVTAFAANCNLLVGYLSSFWPAAGVGWWRAGVITTVVLSLTTVNVIGVRDAARLSNVFTVGKLVPIVLFIVAGLCFINPQYFSFNPEQASYGALSTSVLLLVYAFTGFEMAVIPAGEARNPRRDLPAAILTALAVVALLYTLIQLVCIGTLPALANSARPLADAGRQFLGAPGAMIITAGALISITGNLSVLILSGSRLPFAMAERGELPGIISFTHRRFRTPSAAIMLTAAVMLALTLCWTFISAVTISVIARLLSYASTCAALPLLRRREGRQPALFRAPGGVAAAAAAVALIVWLLSNITWREARDTGVAAACGVIIFFLYRLKARPADAAYAATPAQRDAL